MSKLSVYELTAKSIATALEESEVPEIFVVVAKHQVMGINGSELADILSCSEAELEEVTKDELYVRVKGYVAGVQAEGLTDQAAGWDAIENTAIRKLNERLVFEKDSEFLLKVAAVANRATRRTQPQGNLLDPGLRTGRTTITLTQRLVQKINGNGDASEERTRQLSIADGSMSNPSFGEVDSLLSVATHAVLPKAIGITTHVAEDPTEAELEEEFRKFMGK